MNNFHSLIVDCILAQNSNLFTAFFFSLKEYDGLANCDLSRLVFSFYIFLPDIIYSILWENIILLDLLDLFSF